MRILANENFPADAVSALRDRGHDVAWIRTDSPGITDKDVLDRAQREDRILITFDKDFGELAFRLKLPSLSGNYPLPHLRFLIEASCANCCGCLRKQKRLEWPFCFY